MFTLMNTRTLMPSRDTRVALLKWVVALAAPLAFFTFVSVGEQIINAVISPGTANPNLPLDSGSLIQAAIFTLIFYLTTIALAGYLVAADSGRSSIIKTWVEMAVFVILPLYLVTSFGLIIGLALCIIVWPIYLYLRGRVSKALTFPSPLRFRYLMVLNAFLLVLYGTLSQGQQLSVQGVGLAALIVVLAPFAGVLALTVAFGLLILLDVLLAGILFVPLYLYLLVRGGNAYVVNEPATAEVLSLPADEQRAILLYRGRIGGFWFATVFAVIWLVADLIFYLSGSLPTTLLIWALIRTLLFPVAGYFLGQLGGMIALSRLRSQASKPLSLDPAAQDGRAPRRGFLRLLSGGSSNGRPENAAREQVPNDLPLQSGGATRFYLLLLLGFVIFYPVLDQYLFIVVGFAGLLDLGYVAFFAIGSYVWGILGSPQLGVLTGIHVDPNIWPWFFWPALILAALIAAFWGVLLGAPTLRLRGDYLAIVTLGFGEIVPIVFLELDNVTRGANGVAGVFSPAFPGVVWNGITPVPYYYLILALIALVFFANVRMRDSRMGRAWIAIREDEVAAASSGINLVNTKLLAFGTGAFFSGIAGAYHAAKLGVVSPDAFSFGDSIIYLAMVVIGGIGSIPGVIVGAFVVYSINQFILAQFDAIIADPTNTLYPILHPIYSLFSTLNPGFTFSNIRNLLFGVILVLVMIFRPEGLIPSARRRRELHHTEEEGVEVGALDVTPGAPGFETEVHVE
ncbi:MAG: branched-chain amino acid ABC transporter permease [Chloroflexi bacterium]|nr:MAG: branched-chain amino acid ABC transporter permease [Chloroflexota bacterium]